MFDGLYFEYPFLASVLIVFAVCEVFCKMKLPSIYFPHAGKFLSAGVSNSTLITFLKWIGIVTLVLALMSPVKDETYELDPKEGYEIALILDASESMRAQGFDKDNLYLSRFDVVKNIVSDFISQRKNDNLGLVVFGAYSFVASPLTYDDNILKKIVSQLFIGMAGKYTALYESLAQGVNLLKMSNSKTKIAILLTDGFNTPNSKFPYDVAIDLAKKEGVKVYPIGIGSSQEYNAKVLLDIAKQTGGVAFGASSATQLKAIYKEIDALEKSKIENESYSYLNYYYQYFLLISLASLMLYIYLRNKRG